MEEESQDVDDEETEEAAEEAPKESQEEGKKITQILGASICMLGGFTLGLGIGWSSPADSINKANNDSKNGTNSDYVDIINQMHWVGSLFNVGAMLVMFPIGFILDLVGRKITMLIIAPCVSGSFVLLAALIKLPTWIVGRILLGFFSAAFCVAAPIYVAEIAEPSIRGTLGVFFQLLLVIGITVEFALGKADDVRILGYVSAAFPILFFIAFIFVPESPTFLIMKGKTESAKKSLQWYRGKKYDITSEYQTMEKTVEEAQSSKATFKDLFSTRAARRSLGMSAILMIFQQLSGINILMFYASKIFSDAGSKLSDIDSSIILAVVQIFGTLISTFIVDKFGRKILLYVSHSGMGLFLACMGGWQIFLANDERTAKDVGYIPIIIMCLYLACFSLGSGPIPWTMIGEIFPHNLKSYSAAVSGFLNWCFAFIVTVSYRAMHIKEAAIISVVYFIYSGLCFISLVFFYFFVIETRGKTLEEIQDQLS